MECAGRGYGLLRELLPLPLLGTAPWLSGAPPVDRPLLVGGGGCRGFRISEGAADRKLSPLKSGIVPSLTVPPSEAAPGRGREGVVVWGEEDPPAGSETR